MQGQLATYKEMAAAAEADRGRLEQEMLATAQLATALEARLRAALGAKDAAESRVAASEMRAYEVSQGTSLSLRRLHSACMLVTRWVYCAHMLQATRSRRQQPWQCLSYYLSD